MLNFFKEHEVRGLNHKLVYKMNLARYASGIPWIVTSGLRSVEKNKEIGGVEDSSHLSGLGVDIRCSSSRERFLIIKGALVAGFTRIGVKKGHIHLDIDSTKEEEIIFVE